MEGLGLDFDIGKRTEPLLGYTQEWNPMKNAATLSQLFKDLQIFDRFINESERHRNVILAIVNDSAYWNTVAIQKDKDALFVKHGFDQNMYEDNDLKALSGDMPRLRRKGRVWSFEYFNMIVLHYWYSKFDGIPLTEDNLPNLVDAVENWSCNGDMVSYAPEWFRDSYNKYPASDADTAYYMTPAAFFNERPDLVAEINNKYRKVKRNETFFAKDLKLHTPGLSSGKVFHQYASIFDMCELRPIEFTDFNGFDFGDISPSWSTPWQAQGERDKFGNVEISFNKTMTPKKLDRRNGGLLWQVFNFEQLRDIFWIQCQKAIHLGYFMHPGRKEGPSGLTLGHTYDQWQEMEKRQRYIPTAPILFNRNYVVQSSSSSSEGSDPCEGIFNVLCFCCIYACADS